ncbi:MAG: 3'-5' exonuclease, partial [Pyramidobacter sp.]|nr:3'-5' exonuclease [Pyramidobacter sp.]
MSEAADVFLPGRDGYVVLDTESQGYARFCPIEIALARFSPEGVLLDSYSTLVKPRVSRVSRVVTELTGITTEMVRSAPTPREVMGPVRDFIGGSVIVG